MGLSAEVCESFIRDCIINKDKTKLIHEAIAAGVSPTAWRWIIRRQSNA
jgi:hypothetical protein